MSVGGLGLAGLSRPVAIIQQQLGGEGQGSHCLIHPLAGWVPGSFQRGSAPSDDAHALQRNPPPREAHGTDICHRNLSA